MIKTIEIVSLSSGIIGESLAAHELKIGVERLQAMGLTRFACFHICLKMTGLKML